MIEWGSQSPHGLGPKF